MPLTKIVCTLGPATEAPETIRKMLQAGMTVARLNFSHGNAEHKRATVTKLRRIAREMNFTLAIMGDLQGPKIRVGELPGAGFHLIEGEHVMLTAEEIRDARHEIPFPHPEIIADIHPGDRILLDDGTLELETVAAYSNRLECVVRVGGRLTSHKGVNLPGAKLQIPAMTPKDYEDARLALALGLDYLALSFVRRESDIKMLRAYLQEQAGIPTKRRTGENPNRIPAIVAKIEKPEALEELEAIIHAADAVMVARGDLGVEIAPEQVPLAQKRIIHLCNRLGKPVITATQMLQSMIELPRPTRAEASDVANAILDGSDAVMLSGETATGRYPVEAVQMMAKIAATVEQSPNFPYNQLLSAHATDNPLSNAATISDAISEATVVIAQSARATAILTSTESGRTARAVARHRPRVPLLGITPFEETARRMQLIWGVIPAVVGAFINTDQMIQTMVCAAAQRGYAQVGNNVILTAGIPFEVHGVTNMLKVHTVRAEDVT